MNKMTAAYVREALDYDAATGHLTWRTRPRLHFSTDRGWAVFNAAYAGKRAGDLSAEGYVVVGLQKKVWKAHRLAWLHAVGDPCGLQIDHKNRVRSDNRLCNLRLVGALENAQNASVRSDNKSGLKGASMHKATGRWVAQISVAGRRRHLGLYDTAEEAHRAWAAAAAAAHSQPWGLT